MPELGLSNELLQQTVGYVARIPGALITLAATYIMIRLMKRVLAAAANVAHLEPTARSLLSSSVGFIGWVIGISATLNALGLTQVSLALGGSVALVAMALATGLNTVSQDLLAGIYLLADDDFAIGAKVRTTGVEGEIIRLSMRKTKVRDKDGLIHAIPNRNIDAATYTIVSAAPRMVRGKGNEEEEEVHVEAASSGR
ncbi:MAG: mechanosensitive ion channel family protein [Limnochordia bacterium]|jgi:small-conductance mechanosensitive channel